MSMNDYTVVGPWMARGTSQTAIATKNGCRYRLKIDKSVSYPTAAMPERIRNEKLERCRKLEKYRRDINNALANADANDSSFAYAIDIFMNDVQPYAGVVEAVPFVEGGIDYNTKIKNISKISYEACLGASLSLAKLHAANIIHNDIKPENMVFRCADDGSVKVTLIDFDQSCFVNDFKYEAAGTTGYQAPELIDLMNAEDDDQLILLMKNIGFHTDIFAFGAFMLMTLTGKLPELFFNDKNHWIVKWDHRLVKENYLKDLLDSMLSPDPKMRPNALSVYDTLMQQRFIPGSVNYLLWKEHSDIYSVTPFFRNDVSQIIRERINGEKGYLVFFKNGKVRHLSLRQMFSHKLFTNRMDRMNDIDYYYQFFTNPPQS